MVYVGTASWNIPKEESHSFPETGTHLQKYASQFQVVEINTSFYRDHRGDTYARWAESVPAHFQFSVKLSKAFTHDQRLLKGEKDLKSNIAAILRLKEKLGCLLVQTPPSLRAQAKDVSAFFQELREVYPGPVALEPRHASWNSPEIKEICRDLQISRVIADPDPILSDLQGPDFQHLVYYRLHGSTEIYSSNYSEEELRQYRSQMQKFLLPVWCIFDNTVRGCAIKNALEMQQLNEKNFLTLPKVREEKNGINSRSQTCA